MNIKEEYELYLEFDNIEYLHDGLVRLNNAFLYGNVLISNLVYIEEQDSIVLDFSRQHQILGPTPDYYTAELHWDGIEFIEDGKIVVLKECVLKHKHIGVLKNITSDNFILISTEEHEEIMHHKYPNYLSWILDSEGNPLEY